jgi:hypothetical protein
MKKGWVGYEARRISSGPQDAGESTTRPNHWTEASTGYDGSRVMVTTQHGDASASLAVGGV